LGRTEDVLGPGDGDWRALKESPFGDLLAFRRY